MIVEVTILSMLYLIQTILFLANQLAILYVKNNQRLQIANIYAYIYAYISIYKYLIILSSFN